FSRKRSLRVLHGLQAATMLLQQVWPPSARGTTWSNVSSPRTNCSLQYWQRKRSRRNTLNRVKATRAGGRTYSRSAITEGSLITIDGLRTTWSYSDTTEWLPFTTARTASSQLKIESGK